MTDGGQIDVKKLRRSLLKWFDKNQRSMPWRERPSAYGTVVSEFMLQQTQVATVIPYFESFLQRFPDFGSLAAADESEVLEAWAGLGYYRRARMLHAAAREITERGGLPTDADALKALSGFGAYTTAAVGSIALGLPLAAVDGNVRRVMARIHSFSGDQAKVVESSAERLLDPKRPGEWNQAVMELGATICLPRNPNCAACPISLYCTAFHSGSTDKYPAIKKRPKTKPVREVAVAVFKQGKVLVMQRGDSASFSRLWELPRMDSRNCNELKPHQIVKELTGLTISTPAQIGESDSTFTHHKITTEVYRAESGKGRVRRTELHGAHRWVRPDRLLDLAASSAQKKLFRIIIDAE